MASTTYLNNVDTEKVDQLLAETQANAKYFDDTSIKVAQSLSEPLDNLMSAIRNSVVTPNPTEGSISDDEVESYYIELSNALYFMAEKLERLGIYSDMSSAAAKEVYNKAYLANSMEKDEKGKAKNTVAENTAVAENAAQYETVVSSIYEHAYKILKFKIDRATELISTLKNILKKRMQDSYLSAQVSAPTTPTTDAF